MLFFAFGLIFLVLYYQSHFSKMKRREAEQLLSVSRESEKNERRRIAADLHDGVCGDLSAIRYGLALLEKSSGNDTASILDEIKDGIDNALENTRLVSYQLMPPLLESMGLAAALEDNFKRLSIRTGINFTVEHEAELNISASDSYEIFRVIQEFIANMIKYGNVSGCHAKICNHAGIGAISLTDNGRPFDFEREGELSKGSGLRNIAARLKAIGAKLEQQQVESGNQFIITLKN